MAPRSPDSRPAGDDRPASQAANEPDTKPLAGQVALVSGGGRGIGREVAVELSRRGASVAVLSRTRDELERVVAACAAEGADAMAEVVDAADEAQLERAVTAVLGWKGHVDVAVDCVASIGPVGPVLDVPPREWTSAVQSNVFSTFYLCRAVVPSMIARGKGSVVIFGGGGATAPVPRISAYGTAKAAIVRFAEMLALDVAKHGVRVNCVAPGLVETSIHDDVLAARERAGDHGAMLAAARARDRFVSPRLAAELVAFLASDASAPLTGKLVSAVHDDWRSWSGRGHELNASDLYALRRLDGSTLRRAAESLGEAG